MSDTPKTVSIDELFGERELERASKIWVEDRSKFHARCMAEIVQPNLRKIEEVVGYPMDAGYLSYLLEYGLLQAGV